MNAELHPILFETARLLVRRLHARDLDAMLSVYGDPEAMRLVGDGTALDRDACRRWIEVTDRNVEQRGYGMCAVLPRTSGGEASEPIGFAGLVHPGGQPEPEIKYAFRRSSWGRGFASELVQAMLVDARRRWGHRRVIATVDPAHGASIAVLVKAGMARIDDRIEPDGSVTALFEWVGEGPPNPPPERSILGPEAVRRSGLPPPAPGRTEAEGPK